MSRLIPCAALAAVCAVGAFTAAPASAQSLCDDAGAVCRRELSKDCLIRIGAGSLGSGSTADDAMCAAQLSAYRGCLAKAADQCPGAAAEPDPPQSAGPKSDSAAGGCAAADAREEWLRLRDSDKIDELEALAAFCADTLSGKLAAARAKSLRAAAAAAPTAPDAGAPSAETAPPPSTATPDAATTQSGPGLVFPDSDRRDLTPAEIDRLSRRELRIARNEIFARRGRYFKSADLKAHFGRFDWYRPHAWSVRLNAVEARNVQRLLAAERRR